VKSPNVQNVLYALDCLNVYISTLLHKDTEACLLIVHYSALVKIYVGYVKYGFLKGGNLRTGGQRSYPLYKVREIVDLAPYPDV